MNRRHTMIGLVALAGLASPAAAQSFNLDWDHTGLGSGAPSSSFTGQMGAAGFWNTVNHSSASTIALKNLAGSTTSVTFTRPSNGHSAVFSAAALSGDTAKLMYDAEEGDTELDTLQYSFNNLQAGTYAVITFAGEAGDTFSTSKVNVTGSTSPINQLVGGTIADGTLIAGRAYALHVVTVSAGGTITIQVSGAYSGDKAIFCGAQIRLLNTPKVRVYVNDNAAGTRDGNSWTNAITDLQDALRIARHAGGANTEIWVANGFYEPTTGTNRYESFVIPNNVSMFGGFSGTETTLAQRPAFTLSYLSGAIGGSSTSDNSYTVVEADGVSAATLLDGFFITSGNNNEIGGGANAGKGGGLRMLSGSMTMRGVRFINNYASTSGAGLYVFNGSPTLTECYFYNNESFYGPAIFHTGTGTTRVYNSDFLNNSGFRGGAVYLDEADALIAGSFLHGNYAGEEGGAVYAESGNSQVTIANCTIAGNNSAGSCGGVYAHAGADATINNSILFFNGSNFGTTIQKQYMASGVGSNATLSFTTAQGLSGVNGQDPNFVDGNGADNTWGTTDDNCRLLDTSACIDAGSSLLIPSDMGDVDGDGNLVELLPLDFDGNTRRIDVPFRPDTGAGSAPMVDRGAWEVPFSTSPCCVDFNNDFEVDFSDIEGFLAALAAQVTGACKPGADFNNDAEFDFSDIEAFLGQYTAAVSGGC